MATLGIDFGTSYTFLVKKDGNKLQVYGRTELYEGNTKVDNLLCGSPGIKSVIGYIARDDKWVVGQDVYDFGVEEMNICSDLKTKIRDIILYTDQSYASNHNPRMYINNLEDLDNPNAARFKNDTFGHYFVDQEGKMFYKSAIELSTIFFEKILEDPYNDGFLEDIDYIVFGAPANELDPSGEHSAELEYKSKVIPKIFAHIKAKAQVKNPNGISPKDYVPRPEPVLAGVAYTNLHHNWVKLGDKVLVIDIGGGTSDFAFIQRENNADGFSLPFSPAGWAGPAGKHFDKAVQDAFREEGITISDRNATYAKEQMFLTFFDFAKGKGEDMDLQEMENLYENYCSSGRRASIVENGQSYLIAYNPMHADSAVYYEQKFKELCGQLSSRINSYVDKCEKPDYSTILFVGGTSNSDLLRYEVIHPNAPDKGIIGITASTNGKFHKDKVKGLNVVCFSTSDNARGEVQLTCANAVAIGGAILADRIFSSTGNSSGQEVPRSVGNSLPDIRIKVKGANQEEESNHKKGKKEGRLLLSHQFKQYGIGIDKKDWPPRFTYGKVEEKVEFQILYGEALYPCEKKYYWFKLPKHASDIDVLFLADVNSKDRLAIFCYIIDRTTSARQWEIESYTMKVNCGKPQPFLFPDETRCKKDYIRVYFIGRDSPSQGELISISRSKGKSVVSLINDGFGWNIKKKK